MHACHVAYGRFGGHCTVGNDAGYFLVSVFIGYPLQHFVAAFVVKVDVDIGHRNAVGVEKTLEQQIVFQRVDVGNSQAVCHRRTGCRTTAGPNSHIHLTRSVDKILHDKEVAGISHVGDGIYFEFQSRNNFVAQLFVVFFVCANFG